jgi:hypothetical protein
MSHLSVWLTNHYDTIKDFAGPVAALCAAVSATAVTFMLGRRQVEIAKTQAEVAKTQAEIAERNWRTAADRIKLDLFDRRMKIYDELLQVVSEITSMPHGVVTSDIERNFNEATHRAALLFGPEVQHYLRHVSSQIQRSRWMDQKLPYGPQGSAKSRSEAAQNIAHFHSKFPWLIAPYVQMHQKSDVERGVEPIEVFELDRPAAETGGTAAQKKPDQKEEEA